MRGMALALLKLLAALLVVAVLGLLGIRIWQVESGPSLAVWHTFSPDDLKAKDLGAIAARGEVGALIVTLDSLIRMSSNPFFPYMLERIEEGIPARVPGAATAR